MYYHGTNFTTFCELYQLYHFRFLLPPLGSTYGPFSAPSATEVPVIPGVQAVQAVPPFRQVYFYFTKSEDWDIDSGFL